MSENLNKLREAGIAHPTHDFTDEEVERFESLTPDEVDAVISATAKLGTDLRAKKHDGGSDGDITPDTIFF